MASSPLRPATAAGSVPYWQVPKVLFLAAFRSSSSLGHDYFDRHKAERFQLVVAAFLFMYLYFGILAPLWEYIWVLRSPWVLAFVAVSAAQCVVLGVALRLVRHSRYEQSITLVCIGTWASLLLLTFLNRDVLPVAVLGALLPVVFAEPYVRWQRGLVLLVITTGCVVALVALARLQNISHLTGQSPRWIDTSLLITALPLSAFLILGISWNGATALRISEGQLAERAAQLAASRNRLITAADEERRRLERDLHDGAQQHLVALAVLIQLARTAGLDRYQPLLTEASGLLETAIAEIRRLAHGIYPPLLVSGGLAQALPAIAAHAPVPVQLNLQGLDRYPASVEAALYYVCSEALQNAAKHGGPDTTATITAHADDRMLTLTIIDTGRGFDPATLGTGLTNMTDRLSAIGGDLAIHTAPGRGTRITAAIAAPMQPPSSGPSRGGRGLLPAQRTPESGSADPVMASSPLRPATVAGSMPPWRVLLAAWRRIFSSSLGHDYFDRYQAERFEVGLVAFLASYFLVGIVLPLWQYISVLRSPWLLAIVSVTSAWCVAVGVALRLARHSRYERSITLVCIATCATVSFSTFVNPPLLPAAVLGALLPVVFAEPYVRWQRGLVLLVMTTGCVVALVALARLQNISHLAGQPPGWIETVLIFALVPTSAFFILGIVWNSATALRTSKEQLAERAAQLEASRARLITAADEERRRLERDLHDGAQQHLVALAVLIQLARTAEHDQHQPLLTEASGLVETAITEIRRLAHGIYPPLLVGGGLAQALPAIAAHAPVPVQLNLQGLGRYPASIETALYFCCSEALQNAAKHGGSGTTVTITTHTNDGTLTLTVSDTGRGFDPATIGTGLTNMTDRLSAIGGNLAFDTAPGRGTRVTAVIATPVQPGCSELPGHGGGRLGLTRPRR